MKIDWSKAPEGFPLWLEGTNEEHRKHSGWYRDAGQVFEGARDGQWRASREGQFFTVHRNPGSAPWTGEGLPPVGTVCEARIYDGTGNLAWFECRVIHHHPRHKGSAAIAHGNEELLGWSSDFRPIRTPEQIAFEARDNAVKEMLAVWNGGFEGHVKDGLYALYDSNYRKQVEP